jgi:hypothetical protein
MSDLIRTHEGNPETAESHPDKIHWGKFHLIGKLVCATNEIQAQHENTKEYAFTPRPHVRSLLLREFLMNEDVRGQFIPLSVAAHVFDDACSDLCA